MIWTQQMSVGNLLIDSGHQNLIGMINILEYAIRQKDTPQLLRVFENFCNSTRLHFRDEEKILQTIQFPFIPHKLEHQYFLGELDNTLGELSANKDVWPEYVIDHYPEFMREWLVNHINSGVATLKSVLEARPYDFLPV